MPFLNADVPPIFCLLRQEFMYNLESHHGQFVPCCVFGVASIFGRALGFHCLTENGAQFARLPLHAFCWRKDAESAFLCELELWDCLGEQVSVIAFRYLKGMRCKAFLAKQGGMVQALGSYLFTIDWCGEPYSDDPGDGGHKNSHIIQLDNGNYAALPNNRLQWLDPALVTAPFTDKPGYLTNTYIWKVEQGDRWQAEDSGAYFYHGTGEKPDAGDF